MENTKWYKTEEFDPQENTDVIITFLNEAGIHVGEAHFKDDKYYSIFEQDIETIEEEFKNVIAWTDMPKPYEEVKTYTEIQVEQIISDYERKLVDEIAGVRSEWEKKYNELSKEIDEIELNLRMRINEAQSLERKNKLLEEEMKHIEDDLTFFHGTEFDRDTELAEIVNSLVLEVDEVRKIKKNKEDVLERQKVAVKEFVGNVNNMMKKASESIANRKEDFIFPNYGAIEMESSEPEFAEDTFNVMVIGKDLSVPQREVVKVRMLTFGSFSKKYFQVVEGEYTGERFDLESGIKVK